jgi:hypothetical protein
MVFFEPRSTEPDTYYIRNAQGIHRLSAAAIKYMTDPGWHSDGGGLYLEVDQEWPQALGDAPHHQR